MSFRIIIAGGRDFDDLPMLTKWCDHYLKNKLAMDIVVISGKSKTWNKATKKWIGADYQGEQYADLRGFDVIPFYANWDLHGIAAGPIRNHEMGDYAKAGPDGGGLIAFWDGASRGTKDMIEYAKKIGLSVKIVNY